MKKFNFKFSITILFVTLLSASTRSESCAEEKIVIVCDSVENVNYVSFGSVLTCSASESLNVSSLFPSLSSVLHSNNSEVVNIDEIEALNITEATTRFIPKGCKLNSKT